jgi:CheY-like chemotaxis protein
MQAKVDKLILIIENETSEASSVKKWSLTEGVIPVFVASGVEALLWLGKGNIPDMILADAAMDKMPGEEFIRTIRRSGFFQEIPVLVFGNTENHLTMVAMRQAGAGDHIFLPAEPAFIHERVLRGLSTKASAPVVISF